MRSNFITAILAALLLLVITPQSLCAEPAAEIEHLLHAIGQSECIFTRNGKDHSPSEAEDHLRMKYDRTKSGITTTEAFIDRLASKSSWTDMPYTMRCGDDEPEPSGQWLYRDLALYRQP